jgi:hypothetical protein
MNKRGLFLAVLLWAPAFSQAAEKKVEFSVLGPGYFESNKSGLPGESSHLLFTDQKSFEGVFKTRFVPGGKGKFLPKGAFDSKIVIAAIKRGTSIYTYKVEKLTNDDGVLKLTYTATGKDGGGSARFASPLIVSLPKGKYTSVEFIENGKKVGTVKVAK